MTALICGSMAFDTIMLFKDRFKNHILPEQVHILNVSFLVPKLRREFGGCAGNIAYNLRLLDTPCKPMATVGADFGAYADWMDAHAISRDHLRVIEDSYTAQAYITTDQDDNQITAFHPGAMDFSHVVRVDEAEGVSIGIVSPDGRQGMIEHATQFAEGGIPFIFDPGQGLPMFEGEDLERFMEQASWLALNDYEAQLMQQRTGLTLAQMAERVEAVVVTRGGQGSVIHTRDKQYEIPAAPVSDVIDPTGCGDAYRAGLLYGLMHNMDWETTGRIASLMGGMKIEEAGTQNHRFMGDEFEERFRTAFGHAING